MRVFLLCLLCKILFLKNTDPKNQIKLFLFCRPSDPIFFAVLPVDQKINLILPNNKYMIALTQITNDSNVIRTHNHLFRKRTLNYLANSFILDIQANSRVWIHSETRTWYDNNMQINNKQWNFRIHSCSSF